MRRLLLLSSFVVGAEAAAQTVPRRQIPPSVLTELALLEQPVRAGARRWTATPNLCLVEGLRVRRPRGASIVSAPARCPGWAATTDPGTVEPQEFLTQRDVRVRVRGVGRRRRRPRRWVAGSSRRSRTGGSVVGVNSRSSCCPRPASTPWRRPSPRRRRRRRARAAPVPRAGARLGWPNAIYELWSTLLPVAPFWMIAFVSLRHGVATTVLFWAWRRVGRETRRRGGAPGAAPPRARRPAAKATDAGESAATAAAEVDATFVADRASGVAPHASRPRDPCVADIELTRPRARAPPRPATGRLLCVGRAATSPRRVPRRVPRRRRRGGRQARARRPPEDHRPPTSCPRTRSSSGR
jgi:hypothetical protein